MKTNSSLLCNVMYSPSLSILSNVAFVTTVVSSCWWLQLYEFRHGTNLKAPIAIQDDTPMKNDFPCISIDWSTTSRFRFGKILVME